MSGVNRDAYINLYGEEVAERPSSETPTRNATLPDQGSLAIQRVLGAEAAHPSPTRGPAWGDPRSTSNASHAALSQGWGYNVEVGTTNDNMPTALSSRLVPSSARLSGRYADYSDDRGYTAGAEAKFAATRGDGRQQIAAGLGGHMYTGLIGGPNSNERQDETYAWVQKLWRDPDKHMVVGLGVNVERWGDQGGIGVQNRVHSITGGALGNQLPQHYAHGGRRSTGVGVMADVGVSHPITDSLSLEAAAGATLGTQSASAEAKAGLNLELPGRGRFSMAATALRRFDHQGHLAFLPDVDKTHIGAQVGISYPLIKQLGLELEVGFQKNGRAGEPVTMYVVLRAGGGDRHWLPRQR